MSGSLEREYNISHASICIVADLLSVYKLLRTSFLLGEMLRGSIRLVDSQAVSLNWMLMMV